MAGATVFQDGFTALIKATRAGRADMVAMLLKVRFMPAAAHPVTG